MSSVCFLIFFLWCFFFLSQKTMMHVVIAMSVPSMAAAFCDG